MLSGVLHPYFAHKIDAVEKPQTIQIYNITTKGEFQEKNKEKVENTVYLGLTSEVERIINKKGGKENG